MQCRRPASISRLGRSNGEGIGHPLQYSWASLVAQLVKSLPTMWETWVQSLGWEDPLGKGKATTPVFWSGEFNGLYSPWGLKELDMTERLSLSCFPDSSVGKESTCNAGDPSSIPRSGRSAGEGIGHPLQYSWASLMALLVKNLPTMWETWVRSLGWEDP